MTAWATPGRCAHSPRFVRAGGRQVGRAESYRRGQRRAGHDADACHRGSLGQKRSICHRPGWRMGSGIGRRHAEGAGNSRTAQRPRTKHPPTLHRLRSLRPLSPLSCCRRRARPREERSRRDLFALLCSSHSPSLAAEEEQGEQRGATGSAQDHGAPGPLPLCRCDAQPLLGAFQRAQLDAFLPRLLPTHGFGLGPPAKKRSKKSQPSSKADRDSSLSGGAQLIRPDVALTSPFDAPDVARRHHRQAERGRSG